MLLNSETSLEGAIQHARGSAPRALIITTLGWPSATRLCMAMSAAGFAVAALAPFGHWSRHLKRLDAFFPFRPYGDATASMERAIRSWRPDILIACDDPTLSCLFELHAQAMAAPREGAWLAALIRTSLGDPKSFTLAGRKSALMSFAADEGLDVPATTPIRDLADLRTHLTQAQFPQVLKIDSTWGGNGVRVVRNYVEAEKAFAYLKFSLKPLPLHMRLAKARNMGPRLNWHLTGAPTMVLQQYIDGPPANRAVVCWQGDVLAGLSVRAVETYGLTGTGPATVVQILDHQQMEDTAAHIVRRLRLSGFYGFDFVIDAATGHAVLIEMNSRATPICHLSPRQDADLCGALMAQMAGTTRRTVCGIGSRDVIALFPQELWRNPASQYLNTAFHDVPWEEKKFVGAHLVPPQRRWLGALKKNLNKLRRIGSESRLSDPISLPPASQFADEGR